MFFMDPLLFGIHLGISGVYVFLFIYYLITLTDLEVDDLNPVECSDRLNMFVHSKLTLQLASVFIMLINGHWIIALLNLPIGLYWLYEIKSVPKGNMGVYDPTVIKNKYVLQKHIKITSAYIGYFILMFFLYMYFMIKAFLDIDPVKEEREALNDIEHAF